MQKKKKTIQPGPLFCWFICFALSRNWIPSDIQHDSLCLFHFDFFDGIKFIALMLCFYVAQFVRFFQLDIVQFYSHFSVLFRRYVHLEDLNKCFSFATIWLVAPNFAYCTMHMQSLNCYKTYLRNICSNNINLERKMRSLLSKLKATKICGVHLFARKKQEDAN